MTLLIEEAVSRELEISNKPHYSPTGTKYDHYQMKGTSEEYSAVSIIRAADSMVDPIMKLIPGISIGKILI